MVLNRYITKKIIHATISITIVVCLTVAMLESIKLLELLVKKSISISQFIKMISLLVPQYIAILLPFSLFAAIISTYTTLSKNREIHIMRSIGISNFKLLMPSIQAGILTTLLSLALYTSIMPMGFHQFKMMKYRATKTFAVSMIPQSKFITLDKNTTIFASKVSGLGINNIIIYRKEADDIQILTAKKGGILTVDGKTKVVLYNGLQQLGRGKSAHILAFDEYVITVDINIMQNFQKTDVDEHTSAELYTKMNNNTATDEDIVSFYSRIIYSLLPLLMAMLAGFSVLLHKYNRKQKIPGPVYSTLIMLSLFGTIGSLVRNAISNLMYLNYAVLIIAFSIFALAMLSIYSDRKKL